MDNVFGLYGCVTRLFKGGGESSEKAVPEQHGLPQVRVPTAPRGDANPIGNQLKMDGVFGRVIPTFKGGGKSSEKVVPEKYALPQVRVPTIPCDDADELLDAIGLCNGYTLYLLCTLGLIWTLGAMPLMASAFIAGGPPCGYDDEVCAAAADDIATVADQFDLDRGSLFSGPELFVSIFFVGNALGSTVLTILADKYGRRKVVSPALFFFGLFGVLGALSDNYFLLIAARFLQGFFFSSALINFVLMCECVSYKHEGTVSMVFGLFWVLGYLAVAPVVAFLRSWDLVLFAISAPSCIVAVMLCLTASESFYFLLMQRDLDGAQTFIARSIKTRCTPLKYYPQYDLKKIADRYIEKMSSSASFATCCREHRTLIRRLCFAAALWFGNFLIYNGLSLRSTDLSGDPYLFYSLSGLVEIPPYIFAPLMICWFGRRRSVISMHVLTGVGFFTLILLPNGILYKTLWMLCKFGISCSFACLFVFTSGIFPANIRSTCMGLCTVASNLGAMLSPHLNGLYEGSAFCVYGVVSVGCAIATILLPEDVDSDD